MTIAAPPIDAVPKPAIRTPTLVNVLSVVPAIAGTAVAVPLMGVSLWRDEAATASAAHRMLPELMQLISHVDPALALYYVVMHAWTSMFGTSEIALRIPSLAAAIGAVLVIGALARHVAGPVAGVAASALLALSPGFFSLYAVDARPYALVVLTTVSCAYVAERLASAGAETPRSTTTARLVAWSALAALTIGLQVLAAPALLPPLVWILRRRAGGRRPWAVLVAPAVVGVVGLVMAQRGSLFQNWVLPVSKRQVLVSLVDLIAPAGLIVVVLAVPGLLLAHRLLGAAARRRGLVAGGVAVAWALLPPLTLLVYSRVATPSYVPRYFLSAVPGAVLLVSLIGAGAVAGIAEAHRRGASTGLRRAGVGLLIVAAATAAVFPVTHQAFAPNPDAEDLRGAAAWIESHEQTHDGIVYLPTYAEAGMRWYLGDSSPQRPPNLEASGQTAIAAGSLWTPTTATIDPATVLRGVDRVFVVGYPGPQRWVPVADVGTPVATQISACWDRRTARDFGIVVTLWQRPAVRKAGCDF